MEVRAGAHRKPAVKETSGLFYPKFLMQTQKPAIRFQGKKRQRRDVMVTNPEKKPCIQYAESSSVTLNEYVKESTCIMTFGTVAELAAKLKVYLQIWASDKNHGYDISQYISDSLKPLAAHLGVWVAKDSLEEVVAAHSHV